MDTLADKRDRKAGKRDRQRSIDRKADKRDRQTDT